ncbi:MAG: tryptophan-rich sensory protein [Methanocalculaceae archaeon]|nr:tryptophan-rich sensory protein [Methanocalculaceae archaeon]
MNVLWSYLFFCWKIVGAAAVEIVLLWVAICATMYLFYRIRPVAVYLRYRIARITFATVLTAAIWMLNGGVISVPALFGGQLLHDLWL